LQQTRRLAQFPLAHPQEQLTHPLEQKGLRPEQLVPTPPPQPVVHLAQKWWQSM
jgi:hypothetical protein